MSELVIETIRAEIARQKKRLAALEAALQALMPAYDDSLSEMLRQTPSNAAIATHDGLPAGGKRTDGETGRLAGMSVREAARIILSESDEPLPAREIARLAREMGYRGAKADADLATTAKTFNDIMVADKVLFARLDGRRFTIAPHAPVSHDTRRFKFDRPQSKSRADAIAEIIEAAGHPLSIHEILKRLAEAGQSVPSDPRSAYNSIFGTLTNSRDRFERESAGQWDLIRDRLGDDSRSPNGRVENGEVLHR